MKKLSQLLEAHFTGVQRRRFVYITFPDKSTLEYQLYVEDNGYNTFFAYKTHNKGRNNEELMNNEKQVYKQIYKLLKSIARKHGVQFRVKNNSYLWFDMMFKHNTDENEFNAPLFEDLTSIVFYDIIKEIFQDNASKIENKLGRWDNIK